MTNDSDEVRMVKIEKDIEYLKKDTTIAGYDRKQLFDKIDSVYHKVEDFINAANITYATKRELLDVKRELVLANQIQDRHKTWLQDYGAQVASVLIAIVAIIIAFVK